MKINIKDTIKAMLSLNIIALKLGAVFNSLLKAGFISNEKKNYFLQKYHFTSKAIAKKIMTETISIV